jgi:excisionase family DNA binding protein
MLHVSPKTVNRWAHEGRIPCIVTLGGHRRFARDAVERIVEQMTGESSES